jgi:hypothetical protein
MLVIALGLKTLGDGGQGLPLTSSRLQLGEGLVDHRSVRS